MIANSTFFVTCLPRKVHNNAPQKITCSSPIFIYFKINWNTLFLQKFAKIVLECNSKYCKVFISTHPRCLGNKTELLPLIFQTLPRKLNKPDLQIKPCSDKNTRLDWETIQAIAASEITYRSCSPNRVPYEHY